MGKVLIQEDLSGVSLNDDTKSVKLTCAKKEFQRKMSTCAKTLRQSKENDMFMRWKGGLCDRSMYIESSEIKSSLVPFIYYSYYFIIFGQGPHPANLSTRLTLISSFTSGKAQGNRC